MNESDEIIKKIAETYNKNPEGFISIFEKIIEEAPSNEKGSFYLETGLKLYNLSYFILALASWNKALEYFIKNSNRSGESSCYTNLGAAYYSLGDSSKAIEYHEKALEIDREIGDRQGESKCYTNLGAAYHSLGDSSKAIEYYEKALKIAREIGDLSGESKCYGNLGASYNSLGDFSKAIEYHEKALEIAKEIGDVSGESSCYTNLGIAYDSLGDFSKAIEYHEKALEIDREIGDRQGESKCYTNLGNVYHSLGDSSKAIEYYEKALEIAREIGNVSGESKCYANLGNAYHSLGDFSKAIEYYEKALEIAREIGNRQVESSCYANLGVSYNSLGDFSKAIEYHEKALEIAREIGNRQVESSCYANLGIAYDSLGDFSKAVEYHEKALEIDREIGDRQGESKCYTNLGAAYHSLGDFSKAVEYHEKALEIAREIGDRQVESKCYTNLGNVYYSLGDFSKAVEYHEKALEIDREIGNVSGESKCYANLGIAYHSLEDFSKAVEYHEKALEIAREIGDRQVESSCYTNLGAAYHRLGDFSKAIEYHEKALEIAREIGDLSGESKCYANLGIPYDSLGDFSKAIEYYEKALEIAREIGDLDSERISALNLAKVHLNHLNKPEIAYDYCRDSIELSEKITGRLIEEEHKIGFFSRISDAYQYMVPLCLELKKENESFEFVERGKSRAFLTSLAATKIKPSVKITPELKSLIDEEETYLVKLREIQTRHLRQKKVTVELGEIDRIIEKLNYVYNKIQIVDPEYVFTRRGKPLSLIEIQDMLSLQRRNLVLIEYFLTDNKIFIFVVSSRSKKLHIEAVPISQERLSLYIENYRRVVTEYPDYKDIRDSWLGLSSCLIDPISKFLTEGDLIYFIPYNLLHYLPLHALELNGEPLIKHHPVAYSPSASLISFCKNKGSGKLESCASFGVDPYEKVKDIVEKGAKDVANLFNTDAYIDEDATKDNVMKCMNRDIIHFLCHGELDILDPLSSGVVLNNKKVLTAREILDMKLNTELVTLAACQTGINERNPGDELVGLTRAFLYAGAPSVIVSLWSVDAYSTQELMLEFYKLIKNGIDKATALQKAQIKIMEKKEYAHPYYWAPFVLVGDWE
jgi:tetratricopeptide (TPR) repeat protein